MTDAPRRPSEAELVMLLRNASSLASHVVNSQFFAEGSSAEGAAMSLAVDACAAADTLEATTGADQVRAVEFEAVARNLGQVLQNTASWIEEWEQGGFSTRTLPSVVQPDYLRGVFAAQLAAHNLTND